MKAEGPAGRGFAVPKGGLSRKSLGGYGGQARKAVSGYLGAGITST